MDDDLSGRVVVVTGASSGIGEATARLFAALARPSSSAIIATGPPRSASSPLCCLATIWRFRSRSTRGPAYRRRPTPWRSVSAASTSPVNSAGSTVMVPAGDLDALTDEIFDQVTRTNLRGPFAVIRAFRPLLEKTPQGVVVNISSVSALTGVGSNLAYCAAKAGLDALTLALAKVLGPKIRILSVSPAAVDTDFVKGRDPARLRTIAETTPVAPRHDRRRRRTRRPGLRHASGQRHRHQHHHRRGSPPLTHDPAKWNSDLLKRSCATQ